MKANLAVLLAALMLGGCVYEKRASHEYRERELAPPPQAYSPQPGPPTPIVAPAPRRTPQMQARAPEPDRVRGSDLARLSPGTGVAGPEAEPYRHARRTPHPSRLFVQAASFVTRDEAERTRRSLAGLGRTGVYTAYVDDQLRYRVRVGPLATPERSENVRTALVRRGYGDAIIIRD